MMQALAFALLLMTTPAPAPVLDDQVAGAFFALSVADAPASAKWYRDELGFTIVREGEAPNKIAKFALLQRGNCVIEIIEHRSARPRSEADAKNAFQLHGIFKLGFVVSDLDQTYARVKARNLPIAYDLMPAKDIPLRSFTIRDNSGNLVQFFGK